MLLTSVVLVPLAHPVEMAEQLATLDVLSNGNFRVGAGLGYRPVEFEIFETTTRHRKPWFEESIELMRRLWTEESVNHTGRFFALTDAHLGVRPVQKPYPPVWVAVNAEPAAQRAAVMGDGGPFWAPFVGGDRLRELYELYEAKRIELGRPKPAETCIAREFSIGRTRQRALEDGRAGMIKKWDVYAEHGETPPSLDDFEAEARDTFILGEPAECAEQILRYGEEYDITHMKLRLQYPGMDHEKVMERIKLTSEVIERLR
jgi:alkanesulfonate monooxygenase SsuD/methylene tetrahydromethanopterin reductase-like flavin-dependent oxidoreductase (luciferase family)